MSCFSREWAKKKRPELTRLFTPYVRFEMCVFNIQQWHSDDTQNLLLPITNGTSSGLYVQENEYKSKKYTRKSRAVLVHAMTAHRGDQRWRWVVNFTLRLLYSRKRTPVPLEQQARWTSELVWTSFMEKQNLLPLPGFKHRIVLPVYLHVLYMHIQPEQYRKYYWKQHFNKNLKLITR